MAVVHIAPSPARFFGNKPERENRARRGNPCPQCGKIDQCLMLRDGATIHVWCKRDASGKEVSYGFTGVLYYFCYGADEHPIPIAETITKQAEYPLADDATQHAALCIVGAFLGLTEAHRARLAARGYDVALCGPTPEYPYMFASLPDDPDLAWRNHAATKVLSRGIDAEAILGFAYDNRRSKAESPLYFLPNVKGGALIEFIRDADGRVVGFEYDSDIRDAKRKHLAPKRLQKSRLFHVAPAQAASECWHVEGVHKANILNQYKRVLTVASLGVGNTSGAVAGALAVDADHTMIHIVAVDADKHGQKEETALAYRLLEAGFRVAIARWDYHMGKGPDDAIVNGASLAVSAYDAPESPLQEAVRVQHSYPWQARLETASERQAMLARAADTLRETVLQHIEQGAGHVLTVAFPPGAGKSTAVAEIGRIRQTRRDAEGLPIGQEYTHSIAWIAERHDMAESIQALQDLRAYQHIKAPNQHNCGVSRLHDIIRHKGYNTRALHKQEVYCQYLAQFNKGSAVYQVQHAQTSHIENHQAIIIDELDINRWIDGRFITITDLSIAASEHAVESIAARFLVALECVITDTMRAFHADSSIPLPTGKALFDALDARCNGQLEAWLGALVQDPYNTNTRPWLDLDIHANDATVQAVQRHKVILPHILVAFVNELVYWQRGEPWNSRISIHPHYLNDEGNRAMSLHIIEPRTFTPGAAAKPITVLDATTDATIMRQFWGKECQILEATIDPPPHMQHIAIRTGKRYGKFALEAEHGRDLARAIAEVKHVLTECDPDGSKRASGKVGLITFYGIEEDVRQSLGIPETASGHFWGMRGSNKLEQCEILIILGTPTVNGEAVIRLARSLYFGESALDTTYDDTTGTYKDARLQHLAEYLIRSELTQCAHRNRPLRHDGRVVISFCKATIDHLPITTEITSLPRLDVGTGESKVTQNLTKNQMSLQAAYDALMANGSEVTVIALARLAGVRTQNAGKWLQSKKSDIFDAFPETHIDTICNSGNASKIQNNAPLPFAKEEKGAAANRASDIPTSTPKNAEKTRNTFADPIPDNSKASDDVVSMPDPPWMPLQRVEYWQRRGMSEGDARRKVRQETNDWYRQHTKAKEV